MKKLTNKERCKKCIHKKVCEYQSYFINTKGIDRCNNYSPKANKGYRKQSECEACGKKTLDVITHLQEELTKAKFEWISVDERLPEREGKYIAYTTRGTIEMARCYSYYVDDKLQFDYWVTHWMPLPEPPKMKGGADK